MALTQLNHAKWKEYDDVRVGILYCLASTFLFWTVNALGKLLADTYPIVILVFFRSLFALLMCLALASRMGGMRVLRAHSPGLLLTRGAIWLVMIACSFASYHLMPIADAAAVEFTGPIIIAFLGATLLAEVVGLRRWLAILLGFGGVLLIVRPGFGENSFALLFAFGNALCYALGSLLVRHVSKTENSIAVVFYSCMVATAASGLAVPFYWVSPTPTDWLLFCAIGIFGAGAQYFVTQSFYYAPASTVAPFSYSGLVWALLFGFVIWNELPDALGILGLLTITASGLWLAKIKERKPLVTAQRRRLEKAAAGRNRPQQGRISA
jgi:drug/metabolite transporter (DMT)-like permease